MDWSPPGSSVLGISQARILERVAISFSRGSSQLRDWTCISGISWIVRQIFYQWVTWEAWAEFGLGVQISNKICLHRLLSYEFPVSDDKGFLLPPDGGRAPFPGEIHFLLFRETESGQKFLLALSASQASPIQNDQYAIVTDLGIAHPEPQPWVLASSLRLKENGRTLWS